MDFATTIVQDSAAAPGVKFTVYRMSERIRRELRVQLAGAFAEIREIEADRQDLVEEAAARLRKDWTEVLVTELTRQERRRLTELVEREALVRDTKINPAYLQAGLASIDGLLIDGAPGTTAEDLARVPGGELYREVMQAVLTAAGLAEAKRPNSGSPSTSGAVEGGKTDDTTAPGANESSSTASTTAPAA